MSRLFLSIAIAVSASGLWLVDSAIKGALLLFVAGIVSLTLRRDSAATRHWVWLMAIIAMLVMPLMSAMLPQWRVLPAWAAMTAIDSSDGTLAGVPPESQPFEPIAIEPSDPPSNSLAFGPSIGLQTDSSIDPSKDVVAKQSELSTVTVVQRETKKSVEGLQRLWLAAIPWCWAIGSGLLFLRLLAARALLGRTQSEAIEIDQQSPTEMEVALVESLSAACLQLRIRNRITFLIHPEKTIPIVWGIWRSRLLLPEASRQWSEEQLRSVLLHELAHIKRRDALSQLLAQSACALYWFNPLVWFAAWRLHVERERACDDLVLRSGVRASAYAEHLLTVATRLTSSPWTQACGLAMARSSSLQGRLTAVLNARQNRRSVTKVLLALSILVSAGIAVPVAMMCAVDKALAKDPTDGNLNAKKPLNASDYRDMDAALLHRWQLLEGVEDSIPETRVATLRSAIGRFIEGIEASPFQLPHEKLAALKRLRTRGAEKTRHTASETQDFIKAVFDIHGEPIQMAFNEAPALGTPGNASELSRIAFGPPDSKGLRIALVCEKERFIFGDSARLDLKLWNTSSETIVVGIGHDGFGLYPKLELDAIDRVGRRIATQFGNESQMLKDIKFSRSWQLLPGETSDISGYLLRVGTSTPREAEWHPEWYTQIEMPDVTSGDEIVLTGTLPMLTGSVQTVSAKMQTASIRINAIAPDDVEVWSTHSAGTWPMSDDVMLEIKRELFHAADVASSVVLHWPQDATGTSHAFTSFVASDAFGSREPWHVAWERNSKSFWTMRGNLGDRTPGLPKPFCVNRVDFTDKSNIVTTTWYHKPEEMPEGIRLAFEKRFQPLPTTPRRATEAEGSIQVEQAHDVRPIDELLHGVWKSNAGEMNVQLTFPERVTDGIRWTVNYGQGIPIAEATMSRINSPSNNSIRLWIQPSQPSNVDEKDIVGVVRRGPNSTLLLDIVGSSKYPEYKKVKSIVLTQSLNTATNVALPLQNTIVPDNSSGAVRLPEGLEKQIDWSESIGGLRGALILRSSENAGVLSKERRIFFLIQNVSDHPVRFCDTDIHETDVPAADVEGEELYLKRNGDIMFGLQNAKSTKTDMVLQPNEIYSIDLFGHEKGNERGLKTGDLLAEGILKDPAQSLFAVLSIVHAPEGAWTGKIKTPTTRGVFAAEGHMPTSKEGQALFRYCIDHARLNGDIPGGLLSRLHELVQEFIRNNTDDRSGAPYAKKMRPLLARFERKGDWKQAEVVALLDEIAIVTTIPLERTMEIIRENTLKRGLPLPSSLKDANWGEALPGGLRMAWILEPRENKYHLGSPLKSRVVLHNSGNEPVIFVTRSFHQPEHMAAMADGQKVQTNSTTWTTRGRTEPYRLHPGESCELHAPGLCIGANDNKLEDWSNVRVGTWILAKQGDEIHFQPGAVILSGDHNEKIDADWWLKFVTARIERETPLPTDAKEREVVLFRVISDLFGNSPTPEEASAFLSDKSDDAVGNLAKLLSTRTWQKSVTGSIKSSDIKFLVLPEDPDAATRPRITMNPGHFHLGEQMRFAVSRRPEGERLINEASIIWFPPGKESVTTQIPLPDNYDSWAAGWEPNSTILWVSQPGALSSYDFTDSAAVKLTRYEGNEMATAPIAADVREALRAALEKAVPQDKRAPQPPASVVAPK